MLTLEQLQADFYTETQRNRVLQGALEAQATVVGSHERAHARALYRALESHAAKQPRFDFGGATEGAAAFQRTAVAFEDLSVAAYKAQVPRIVEREYLTSAMAIHSVGRATPRGSGGWRASRRPRTRSTSRGRSRARWASSPRRSSRS
jgi:hypothetical protein